MTILTEHPWTLVFYLLAVLLQCLVTFLPQVKLLGLLDVLFHSGTVVVFCLFDGTLEDTLLFLLFSLAVGLALALLVPDKRNPHATKKEESK